MQPLVSFLFHDIRHPYIDFSNLFDILYTQELHLLYKKRMDAVMQTVAMVHK